MPNTQKVSATQTVRKRIMDVPCAKRSVEPFLSGERTIHDTYCHTRPHCMCIPQVLATSFPCLCVSTRLINDSGN
jgi:hypothetical protein